MPLDSAVKISFYKLNEQKLIKILNKTPNTLNSRRLAFKEIIPRIFILVCLMCMHKKSKIS